MPIEDCMCMSACCANPLMYRCLHHLTHSHTLTGIDALSAEYRAVIPKDEDLHGAALALIRLQDTYNLNVSEMASGQISGSAGHIRMTGTLAAGAGESPSVISTD